MARNEQAPPEFAAALASLASARLRSDVRVVETVAPARIAPYAAAINGEFDDVEASGRFVVLHDPQGHEGWDSTFRVVSLVKAQVEPEVGADELAGDVAWSWLTESLAGVEHHSLSGTVTTVMSQSYGDIDDRPREATVEVRAAWSPVDSDMEPHIRAWAELMAQCAGVPPLPEGVSMLHGRKA